MIEEEARMIAALDNAANMFFSEWFDNLKDEECEDWDDMETAMRAAFVEGFLRGQEAVI